MDVIECGANALIKAWIEGVDVEQNTITQASQVARLPFVKDWVALMPDCHWGKGSTVGSVIPTVGAVIPSAVGVDIGCGMISWQLREEYSIKYVLDSYKLDLSDIRAKIENRIPIGRSDNGGRLDIGAWNHNLPEEVLNKLNFCTFNYEKSTSFNEQGLRHPRVLGHLGTLGTGNHFIEIEEDENELNWITIHSGSRGPGARIGNFFMKLAKTVMEKYFIKLESQDLAYLPQGTEEFNAYMQALSWAQKYAWYNREIMMRLVAKTIYGENIDFDKLYQQEVHCHHNYAAYERHFGKNILITRKGAISAQPGQMGIIPGSMGAKTYIVKGKGNRNSFMSASHGAGRKMGRKEAIRTFTIDDHIKATNNIECLKDQSVLDETPMAYKDIDAVMEAQEDLVEVVHTLRPILVIKGTDSKKEKPYVQEAASLLELPSQDFQDF